MKIVFCGFLLTIVCVFIDYANGNFEDSQFISNCGESVLDAGKMYGGRTSQKGEAPWKIAILKRKNDTFNFRCGGSLISENLVLTVAHCVHPKYDTLAKKEDLTVYVGAHNLSADREAVREVRNVENIIIHEGWDPLEMRYTHDIALLRLNASVKFKIHIQPICIFTDHEYLKLTNNSAQLTAWGEIDDEMNIPDEPRTSNFETLDLVNCFLFDHQLALIHWPESFCAKSNMSGACKGDSGSGLYVKINDRYFLRGLVSSSIYRDCSKKSTALYSDVMKYYQFIKTNFYSNPIELNCTLEFKYNTTCDECYKCFANFDKCSTVDTCNEIKTNIDSLSYDKIGVIEFKPRLNGFPKIQKGLIDSTFKKFFEIEIILDTHGNRKLTKNIPSFLNNFKSESFLKLILKTCEIDEKSKNILNELRQFESLIIARSLFENYTLPQEFLKSQTKLNRLELSYNNLKFLPTHVFSDLRDLRDLLLQNNQLSSLPSDIFKMNVNLKRLDLKRNQIKKLPVDIFSTLKLLRTLSLDGNQIEILPEKLFNNNLKLEKFWIVGNKLKQISFEFSSLPELSILDIRQNKCCDCRADSKENFPKILNLIKTKC